MSCYLMFGLFLVAVKPLALIGKGAFGEVRLVRMRERFSKEIYAMKSMLKEAMIMKNQVGHVRAERDILTESENPWIVMLYYTFQVKLIFYFFIFYLNRFFSRTSEICIWSWSISLAEISWDYS